MFKIRKGVFETNSSSMHSLAVDKLSGRELAEVHIPYFKFDIGEFGWSNNYYEGLGDYIWTYLCCRYSDNLETLSEYKNKLYDLMSKYADEVEFEEPIINKEYGFLEDGYIDHYDELDEFIEHLFNNERLLISAILRGRLETGNDNGDYRPEDMEGDYTFYKSN